LGGTGNQRDFFVESVHVYLVMKDAGQLVLWERTR
jgi:hypothetical protein